MVLPSHRIHITSLRIEFQPRSTECWSLLSIIAPRRGLDPRQARGCPRWPSRQCASVVANYPIISHHNARGNSTLILTKGMFFHCSMALDSSQRQCWSGHVSILGGSLVVEALPCRTQPHWAAGRHLRTTTITFPSALLHHLNPFNIPRDWAQSRQLPQATLCFFDVIELGPEPPFL